MSHLHSIYDADSHFIIQPGTRLIENKSGKVKLSQYDHQSERFTFEIPRMIEGHDMSQSGKIEVHYINISTNKGEQIHDVYLVEDAQTGIESDNVLTFSWLISGNATKYAGSLNFLIRFVCLDGDKITYAWNTEIFKGITVSEGMNNGEPVIVEYSDVLEAWKREVFAEFGEEIEAKKAEALVEFKADCDAEGEIKKAELIAEIDTEINAKKEAAKEEITATESDPTVPAWAKKPNPPTPAEIGAAPAGFGLGIDFSNTSATTDVHDISANGWYRVLGGTTANIPNYDGVVLASVLQPNYRALRGYFYSGSLGTVIAEKICHKGVWGEWEYVNPPVQQGVEYRTTERHKGNPVYCRLLSLGWTGAGDTNIDLEDVAASSTSTGLDVRIINNNHELITNSTAVTNVWFGRHGGYMRLSFTTANAHGSLEAILKYTK